MHSIEERSISCMVVTVSDTRTIENDKSGKLIIQLLEEFGHKTEKHLIVPDDEYQIEQVIKTAIEDERIQAILFTGGTGISKRDVTIEVVSRYIKKEIPGFGELFRMLSYTEDIGSSAIMSRAEAGIIADEKVLFSMPGSSGAVKLAMNKLIMPQLSHIFHELNKHRQ